MLGFFVCLVSTLACFLVYWGLKKKNKNDEIKTIEMVSQSNSRIDES